MHIHEHPVLEVRIVYAYRGQSCLTFFLFFVDASAPSPQTTLESTAISGRTFEHVEHIGRGLPSGPRGTSGLGESFGASGAASEGRVRRTRVSTTSSFFTLTSSLSLPIAAAFPERGVATGVGVALPLPLPLLFFSLNIREETDRVSRLGEGSTLRLGEASSDWEALRFPVALADASSCDSRAAARWRRVDMMERNGVDWLLLGVERPVVDVSSVRDDEDREADAPTLRSGVMRSGVVCFAGLEPSEGGIEVANDVNSDPVSTSRSAINSISPSAGTPMAPANGTLSSSSSLSLSSLLSSFGLVTA